MLGGNTAVITRAVALLAALHGCGGANESARLGQTLPPPQRTAAEDESLRHLLLDLSEAHLCERLENTFVALPDGDAATGAAAGASPAAGRLWIQRCTARREGDQLALHLQGPGWTWVEQSSAGPLGTSFTVRGHLRFNARVALRGEIDVSYAEHQRLVSVWLTPRSPADATVAPTGAVPVAPDGGWSSFIGAVGGVFGDSIEERARPMVEEQGSAQMAERLSAGFTFTIDLCTGQADSIVGPLGNGEVALRPYAPDGTRWLANQRVRLRPGSLDVAGPFAVGDTPLHMDYDVEEGRAIRIRAYCEEQGTEIARAFVAGRSPHLGAPLAQQVIERGAPTFLELDTSDCPVLLVATPMRSREPTVFRYRAFALGAAADPVVRCE